MFLHNFWDALYCAILQLVCPQLIFIFLRERSLRIRMKHKDIFACCHTKTSTNVCLHLMLELTEIMKRRKYCFIFKI